MTTTTLGTPASAATRGSEDLHPRIAELIRELDDARARLHALLAALPDDTKSAPAAEGGWSVTDVVEHLAIVEDGAGRVVSKIIGTARAKGMAETDTSSILPLNEPFGIEMGGRRIEAPEMVKPRGGVTLQDATGRLDAARERLKQVLRDASGVALGEATFPHPAFGPLNGYQWALATAQHEKRHVRQLRRLVGMSES